MAAGSPVEVSPGAVPVAAALEAAASEAVSPAAVAEASPAAEAEAGAAASAEPSNIQPDQIDNKVCPSGDRPYILHKNRKTQKIR